MGVFGDSMFIYLSNMTSILTGANLLLVGQSDMQIFSSKILASKILVQGSKSMILAETSTFTSTLTNTCNIDTSGYAELFYCVPKGATYNSLSYD